MPVDEVWSRVSGGESYMGRLAPTKPPDLNAARVVAPFGGARELWRCLWDTARCGFEGYAAYHSVAALMEIHILLAGLRSIRLLELR